MDYGTIDYNMDPLEISSKSPEEDVEEQDSTMDHESSDENASSDEDPDEGHSRPALIKTKSHYNWKEYSPSSGGCFSYLRWFLSGTSDQSKQSDEDMIKNMHSLARMLLLLREYEDRFGIPEEGGPRVQEMVLREVIKDLRCSGAPVWVIESVMERCAEGLTGKKGHQFSVVPRRAFIFHPSSNTTTMFRTDAGYCMSRLDAIEQVVVRLASFASNTGSVTSIQSRMPSRQELRKVEQKELSICSGRAQRGQKAMAKKILNLASETYGLFFFLNSPEYKKFFESSEHPADSFWTVEDSSREIFTRLAAVEAEEALDKIDSDLTKKYHPLVKSLFFIGSSVGACAIWYGGSFPDMIVAGFLAVVVSSIGTFTSTLREERIISEIIASFVVGFVAAMIALRWPDHMCFGAMSLAGVLDIMQGFKVVMAVIEIMSKNTMNGAANILEGILFTSLISYNIRFGRTAAISLMGEEDAPGTLVCTNGINQWWYFLFVPIASISWSGLFAPDYKDLPIMMMHGVLCFVVSWALSGHTWSNSNLTNYLSAMSVALSAGIISRFTGRQAIGNTAAGLYVLLPGAYMIKGLFADTRADFIQSVILDATMIGIGAWTGTLLCSPTILGTNRGLLQSSSLSSKSMHMHSLETRHYKKHAMLYF